MEVIVNEDMGMRGQVMDDDIVFYNLLDDKEDVVKNATAAVWTNVNLHEEEKNKVEWSELMCRVQQQEELLREAEASLPSPLQPEIHHRPHTNKNDDDGAANIADNETDLEGDRILVGDDAELEACNDELLERPKEIRPLDNIFATLLTRISRKVIAESRLNNKRFEVVQTVLKNMAKKNIEHNNNCHQRCATATLPKNKFFCF